MATAEEHLKADMGNMVMQLMFQLSLAKAEIDRLKVAQREDSEEILNNLEQRDEKRGRG